MQFRWIIFALGGGLYIWCQGRKFRYLHRLTTVCDHCRDVFRRWNSKKKNVWVLKVFIKFDAMVLLCTVMLHLNDCTSELWRMTHNKVEDEHAQPWTRPLNKVDVWTSSCNPFFRTMTLQFQHLTHQRGAGMNNKYEAALQWLPICSFDLPELQNFIPERWNLFQVWWGTSGQRFRRIPTTCPSHQSLHEIVRLI